MSTREVNVEVPRSTVEIRKRSQGPTSSEREVNVYSRKVRERERNVRGTTVYISGYSWERRVEAESSTIRKIFIEETDNLSMVLMV